MYNSQQSGSESSENALLQVRVKVHSTSVNPIDYKITESDQYGTQLPKARAHYFLFLSASSSSQRKVSQVVTFGNLQVPGGDVAGIVDEDGEKVSRQG